MGNFDPADFVTLYPGVYSAKEKPLVEKYLAANKAINERGDIDVQALVNGTLPAGTPGVGPVLPVTEAMVRYNSEKYDPENPLANDADYARSLGYQDILAFPTFGAHDDTFMVPYPPEARDTLLVSQLNHSVTIYAPIFPGDTLYLVHNKRNIYDFTPAEGSVYRHLAIVSEGSIYNQRAEKVNDVMFSVMESIKVYKDDKRPAVMGFPQIWEAPDWMQRPAHYYTDKDWAMIKEMWAAEKRQGSQPLYWDDVAPGTMPTATVDGPILESLVPTTPYGLGTGGSRTLKKEIMDPALSKTLIRDEKNGIYKTPSRDGYVPAVPDGAKAGFMIEPDGGDGAINTADIHKQTETRAPLINFLGRELAIRHINNWMGDHGQLRNIRWGIMPVEAHAALGKVMPRSPKHLNYLAAVPSMQDRKVLAHGLTEDLAIVRSYVYDKYCRDGEYRVDLTWWIETIEGDIWLAGGATVKLPAKAAGKV